MAFTRTPEPPNVLALVCTKLITPALLALYGGPFRRGFVLAVLIGVPATTLVGTLWVGVLFG